LKNTRYRKCITCLPALVMGGWVGLDFSQPMTLTSLSYNSVTSSLALVFKLDWAMRVRS